MSCELHKDALIEAAASGTAPEGELRAHLAACPSCREAFAQEQSLFASIDSGLHSTANAEVPPSLLPRVRARLDEAPAPRFRWMQPLIFASASLALAFWLFLLVRPHRTGPLDEARQTPVFPAPIAPKASTNGNVPPARAQIAGAGVRHAQARNSTLLHSAESSKPEVLVPPDEREAMARFVATLSEHQDFAAAVLAQAKEKNDALLTVDPLHIADIDVKPLQGSEAETGSVAEDR